VKLSMCAKTFPMDSKCKKSSGKNKSKTIECSAPEYIDFLLQWVQGLINNEEYFPSQAGSEFPNNFQTIVKNIVRRLFRVYAHIYYTHVNEIQDHIPHLNTSFKHLIYFVLEFNLIPDKELEPLQQLINDMKKQDEAELARLESERESY